MRNSIRPWATAGIAVVGAGVIAVAPFEPSTPRTDVQITSSAVRLTAIPNPFEYYPQVVMRSLENATDRLGEYLAEPLPIVKAIAQNQFVAFTDIVESAGRGDVIAVVTAVLRAIATPVVNLMKVAGSGEPFRTAASFIVRLALPIVSGVIAAGSAVGDVFAALADLDLVGAFSALTNIPARIVDGLLNGRVDALSDEHSGLLAPVVEAPIADQVTGPVAFLIDSLQEIGHAIAAPQPAPLGAGPVETTTETPTVTLTVPPAEIPAEVPAAKDEPTPKPPSAAHPSEDPSHENPKADDPRPGDEPAVESPSAPGGTADEGNEPVVPNAAPATDDEGPAPQNDDETAPEEAAAEAVLPDSPSETATDDSSDAEASDGAGTDDAPDTDTPDTEASDTDASDTEASEADSGE